MNIASIIHIVRVVKSRLGILYLRRFHTQLSVKPLDGAIHYQFAIAAIRFGLYSLAYAELKCAEYLGFDSNKIRRNKMAC